MDVVADAGVGRHRVGRVAGRVGARTAVQQPPIADGRSDFAAVYRAALPEVYRYLTHRCGSTAVAEDLTQDTFLAAAASIREGRAEEVTVPWLMRVARNKLVDHYRRHAVEVRAATRLAGPAIPDELVVWQNEASRDRAAGALLGLPPAQRLVVVLRYMDGLAVPEIAALVGRSVHATESLLARGRENFKRHYTEATDA